MLLTVSDQIVIIYLCKGVSAINLCFFSGINVFVQIVNTNVNVETSA